jgi:hypothetical protein
LLGLCLFRGLELEWLRCETFGWIFFVFEKKDVLTVVLSVQCVFVRSSSIQSKGFLPEQCQGAVKSEEVLGAILRETDINCVDERKDDKEAKTEEPRKEIPEGICRGVQVNVDA